MDNVDFSKCWYEEVCRIRRENGTCDTEHCIRFLEMAFLMENSGLPKARQFPLKMFCDDCDYEAFCQLSDLKDTIEKFIFNGDNLYICGRTTGNGKTSWAIKLLLKHFDNVWAGNGFRIRGCFKHVPTLLGTLKDFSKSSTGLRETLEKTDIVVWDDIASSDMSGYDNSNLLMLIDQRVLAGKANIFTGNLVDENDLKGALGNRLTSRILSGTVIELMGKDRRR